MFRIAISAFRNLRPLKTPYVNTTKVITGYKKFSTFHNVCNLSSAISTKPTSILYNRQILDITRNIVPVPSRTVTKFSLNKGKRKTVKAAVRRFFRLHWGGWIRTKIGRHKKLWKKSSAQKRRLRQHVFCNATQNTLLDKMVTKFWKRPKYYVEDPYAPYHTREEFVFTRKKPLIRN